MNSFAQLKDDGTTACGCWVYSGCYTKEGNQIARRDNSDPGDRGIAPHWSWSWPANRRVLYNRASCDPQGKPWSEKKKLIEWNGSEWVGLDVPDYGPAVAPAKHVGSFIMNEEGVARVWVAQPDAGWLFPAHYGTIRVTAGNLLAPKVKGNPVSCILQNAILPSFTAKDFPYVATNYRLTEHFHLWTKHSRVNAIMQPEFFVEISEQLAAEKRVAKGPLIFDGRPVHVVGIPHHYGFNWPDREGLGTEFNDTRSQR